MSKTVLVTWTLPTTRKDGSALAASELSHCEVQLAVVPTDGSEPQFVEVAKVPSPDSAFTQTELEPGDYVFRIVPVDKQKKPKKGSPTDAPFAIELAEPSAVADVAVTVQ